MKKIIIFVLIFILVIIFFSFKLNDSILKNKLNNYCKDKGYFGVYIKQEKLFYPKDYFCIKNKNDSYYDINSIYLNNTLEYKLLINEK